VGFGPGKPDDGKIVSIEIVWPSGQKDSISGINPNQSITVKEGRGIGLSDSQGCVPARFFPKAMT
jgi:hypothetical protein